MSQNNHPKIEPSAALLEAQKRAGAEKSWIAKEAGIQIAKLLTLVDTDYRGVALKAAANELKTNSQGFTGRLMDAAAREYGGV